MLTIEENISMPRTTFQSHSTSFQQLIKASPSFGHATSSTIANTATARKKSVPVDNGNKTAIY